MRQPPVVGRALLSALTLALSLACRAGPGGGIDPAPLSTPTLPTALSDDEFRRLVQTMSEPGGAFHADNFVSNEGEFASTIASLDTTRLTGGVYLGVGPEQNFSYIAALRPRLAFIIDIRRQAMIQHLMYKALFELSADRAEFISRLFSKPRPLGLDSTSTIEEIWVRYWWVGSDSLLFKANLGAVLRHLTRTRGVPLPPADSTALAYVYGAFFEFGPSITFSGYARRAGELRFADLMVTLDRRGAPRSFLSTEERFRFVRDMHVRNLIVPLVGDFAGPKAIRAVGDYVRERGSKVTAFYVSNVEQYLFHGSTAWERFYANVETLPIDPSSVFIRPHHLVTATRLAPVIVINGVMAIGYAPPDPAAPRGTIPTTRAVADEICPIATTLPAIRAGQIRSYTELNWCVK